MAFLVFGTKHKATTLQRGVFFCPQCARHESYELKSVRQYGTLYFMPAISLGEKGSFVECRGCGGTFLPAVLDYDPEATTRAFAAEFQKGIIRVALQMMMADGVIADQEVETIQNIYTQLSGGTLSEAEIFDAARSLGHSSERELLDYLSTLSMAMNDKGREQVYQSAYWIAGSDGRLEDEEEALLNRIADALGLSEAHARVLRDAMTVRRG
jgi:uncharacterized tellurite resistance protein B-like protein